MTKLEMLKKALELGKKLNTEWAEENEAEYNAFADEIEREYAAGELSAESFNTLALFAFYDYDGMKETDGEVRLDETMGEEMINA